VVEDAWLTERLGRPVLTVTPGEDPGAVAGPALLQAKVDAADVAEVLRLERLGFGVVDVNVTLARGSGRLDAPAMAIDLAGAHDAAELRALAERDLRVSRFHRDPMVDDAAADRIKGDWAEAAARGERGDGVLVARDGAEPIGFLAVLDTATARVIDLMVVRGDQRGRGVGRALVAALLARGGERFAVGTQVANVAAIAFYEACGFRLAAAKTVLHRHVP
jgi:GNAT superfamily N-acetyltransferase